MFVAHASSIFLFASIMSLVAWMVKHLPTMWETWVRSLGWEDPLEKEMATHSSIHAWKIPRTEEPGGLQSMGSQRVGYDWATSLHFTSCPLFLPFFPSLDSMSPHHLSRQGSSHYDQSLANLLNLFALFSLHCTCLQNSQTCLNLALYQLYVFTQVAEHGWSKSTNHGDLPYLKFIVTNLKLNYRTIIIFSSFSFHSPYIFPFYLSFPIFLYYFPRMTSFCYQNKYSQQRFSPPYCPITRSHFCSICRYFVLPSLTIDDLTLFYPKPNLPLVHWSYLLLPPQELCFGIYSSSHCHDKFLPKLFST